MFLHLKAKLLGYLLLQDSESEEDILDEGDDDVEEEHEHEHEQEVPIHPESVLKKPPEVSERPKEAERQLSKKERKKKELAELEALLADFGVTQKESDGQDESSGKHDLLSFLESLTNLSLMHTDEGRYIIIHLCSFVHASFET